MTDTKFNFVIDCTDAELPTYTGMSLETQPAVSHRRDLCWCLQAYSILAERQKLPVVCSNCLLPDAINIVHSEQLLRLRGSKSDFIVCVQADYPKRRWAHYHLVQNEKQLDAGSSLVPLWIQPGLIKRDSERRGVHCVAYAGQVFGNLAGDAQMWKSLLAPHGLEFVFLPEGAYHDLSSVDVLIGIRSFDTKPHNRKPPSKLINAWHARIPFIGGYDSAFRQVGQPEEDYLLATTPQQIVAAVLRLRDEAGLYEKLVRNGLKKSARYTTPTIASVWEDILTGPVRQRYRQWTAHPAFEQARFQALLALSLLEHGCKQAIKRKFRA